MSTTVSESTPATSPSTVWFQCSAGVAGDMLLSSLVDASRGSGSAVEMAVLDAVGALHDVAQPDGSPALSGVTVTFEPTQRCGVRSTWMNAVMSAHEHGHGDHDHDHNHDSHDHDHRPDMHRPARDVLAMIRAADLPETVIEWATAVYSRLAEVEGAIHGIDPDEVELHEVGADDSIVDVVGVCAALHALGVGRVCHGPIAVGHGTVETRHGTLANPVPAVSELLAASRSPAIGIDTTMELSTPTGVALITVLAEVTGGSSGPMPDMTVTASGFGAGTADTPGRPNVVQAVVGEELTSGGAHSADRTGREAIVIETNVDDVTPEVLAYTIERLLEAGAHDAWITPIVMKKGRPAHTVHALCDESVRDRVAEVLISETGTLGVRAHHVERWPQPRDEITVTIAIDGAEHDLSAKLLRGGTGSGGDVLRVDVEFSDAADIARATGRPVREILAMAELAARGTDGNDLTQLPSVPRNYDNGGQRR
ncbi:MAG: nickel pincer cofactor biosynthesis protein LarC [Ilumatobacteraceae bacterium]